MPSDRINKLIVYYLVAFLQGIALILMPAASYIFKSPELNAISDEQYGLLFLPMNLACIATTVWFKPILEKLGAKRVYYYGLFSGVISLVFFIALRWLSGNNFASFISLLISDLFLGIAFGLVASVLSICLIELFPTKRDSAITGFHSSLGLGAALSPLLVNFFYERGEWAYSLFFTLGLLLLIIGLSIKAKVIEGLHHLAEEEDTKSISNLPLPWGAKFFLLATLIYGIAESIIGNWSTIYLSQTKQFSITTSALSLAFFWGFITVGRILASFLTFRVDARWLYRASPFLMFASLVYIIVTGSENKILLGYLGVGLGFSYFFPLSVSLSSQYYHHWHKSLNALVVAGLMIGVSLGSTFVGILKEKHWLDLNQAFAIAAFCALLLALISFLLTRKKPTLAEPFVGV